MRHSKVGDGRRVQFSSSSGSSNGGTSGNEFRRCLVSLMYYLRAGRNLRMVTGKAHVRE
jgi:hypothetical protein